MYRGMVPPLLGVTPIFAVSFWVRTVSSSSNELNRLTFSPFQAYDASKALIFALTPNRTQSNLTIAELATAGFLSAVPTTAITAPVERAKVLLQVSHLVFSFNRTLFDIL